MVRTSQILSAVTVAMSVVGLASRSSLQSSTRSLLRMELELKEFWISGFLDRLTARDRFGYGP